MPPYELTLILRGLAKNDLVASAKRLGKGLLDSGAVIEKIESLGLRDLPFRMSKNSRQHKIGNYFLFHCWLPVDKKPDVAGLYKRDNDVLQYFFRQLPIPGSKEEFVANHTPPCTLHEEMLPPAERPSVIELRRNQRMCKRTRVTTTMRAIAAKSFIPKSYFIREAKK